MGSRPLVFWSEGTKVGQVVCEDVAWLCCFIEFFRLFGNKCTASNQIRTRHRQVNTSVKYYFGPKPPAKRLGSCIDVASSTADPISSAVGWDSVIDRSCQIGMHSRELPCSHEPGWRSWLYRGLRLELELGRELGAYPQIAKMGDCKSSALIPARHPEQTERV